MDVINVLAIGRECQQMVSVVRRKLVQPRTVAVDQPKMFLGLSIRRAECNELTDFNWTQRRLSSADVLRVPRRCPPYVA